MNTTDLIRSLENAANFAAMEALTAKRVGDIDAATKFASISNDFKNAASSAKSLHEMCVQAITTRIERKSIQLTGPNGIGVVK